MANNSETADKQKIISALNSALYHAPVIKIGETVVKCHSDITDDDSARIQKGLRYASKLKGSMVNVGNCYVKTLSINNKHVKK